MRVGIDTYSPPSIALCKELGASFVVVYSSRLTKPIAEEFAGNDIDIVLLFESSGASYQGGAAAGELEAHRAVEQAIAAGMVGGYPIIFAPYDPFTPEQNIDRDLSPLLPYYDGVASVLPLSRIWAYGDFAGVRFLLDNGKVSGVLQSAAASEGQWDERAQIRQTEYRQGYDVDVAMVEDFGQWRPGVPFHSKPPTSPISFLEPDERATYEDLQAALKHPVVHRKRIATDKARLTFLRKAIYRAAVDGILPSGRKTEPGWNVNHRAERYHFIEKIVPPQA